MVTPDHEQAFVDVVAYAGQDRLLRQLYVHRGGHCTLTLAETHAALDVLLARIETGTWGTTGPEALNEAARRFGADDNVLTSGDPAPPAFCAFEPPPFPRPYDGRDVLKRREIH